jgi:Ca2+-binding RTX toxin-like protein/beta-glucanase (GH16 family)
MTVYTNFWGAVMPVSGNSADTITGSSTGSESLSGTSANDLIVGGGLGHLMSGGAGDDSYTVSSSGDSVSEAPGGGIDTVTVKLIKGFVMPDNVENIIISSKATGIGNSLGNLMIGGVYSQTFDGGPGDDVMVGKLGADTFQFGPNSGHDVVWDFNSAEGDNIRLQGYGFTTFAQVQSAMTQVGSDVILTLDANDQVKFLNTTLASFHAYDFQLELDRSQLKPSFSDEFNSLSLYNSATGTGTWSTTFPFGLTDGTRGYTSRTLLNNNEKEIYVDPSFAGSTNQALGINPFDIHDGILDIVGQKTDQSANLWYYKYTSGLLTTYNTFSQEYGYFEVNAKLPAGNGLWPAFWLLPTSQMRGVELDALEQIGHEMVYFTSHSTVDGVTRRTNASYVSDFSSTYHKYGLLWTTTEVSWYIDGVKQASLPTPSDMHQPMYMLLNLAIGGNWPGDPDPSFQSARYSVDYVHAFNLSMLNGQDGDLSVALPDKVGSGDRAHTAYTVTGIDDGATAAVTFTDSAGHVVTVQASGNGANVADLTPLQEGSVTVSILETKGADTAQGLGATFALDSSIDTDLAVTGMPLKVGAAIKAAAPFTVVGLNAGDVGTVIFTDINGAHVTQTVSANGPATADLSTLADGAITVTISESTGVGLSATGTGGSTILDSTADNGGDLAVSFTNTDIEGVAAVHVNFTIVGLDKDSNATLTFTDHLGDSVTANVAAKSTTGYVDLTGLADGPVNVTITATDGAFNVANGAGATLNLDLGEASTGFGVAAAPTLIGKAGIGAVAYGVSGLPAGTTGIVTFTDSQGSQLTVDVPSNGIRTIDLSSFHDGPVAVAIVADDGAGHTTPGAGGSVTLDTTADAGGDLAMTFNQPDGPFDVTHVAYAVSGLDSDATAVVTFTDNVGDSITVNVAANGPETVDLSSLAPGAVTVIIEATDAAGNTAPDDPSLKPYTIGLEEVDFRPIEVDHFFRSTITHDTITGTSGNDMILAEGAGDVVDGGDGEDTLSYAWAPAAVTVMLRSDGVKEAVGGAGKITMFNFENLVGSAYDDTLTGDAGPNKLIGGAGNDMLMGKGGDDLLVGGPGDDVLTGGAGNDTAWYGSAPSAVTIDLNNTGPQDTGGAGVDTLVSMENVVGSDYADVITGDGNPNVLDGGKGDDVLSGGKGADTLLGGDGNDLLEGGPGGDLLDGGAGVNTASYGSATGAIRVDLTLSGPQYTGKEGYDTLLNIQNISGSNFADTLSGDDGSNVLFGGDGNDLLDGRGGNDVLNGGAGADTIIGGAGDDALDGGDGIDTVSYASATSGVTVDLRETGPQDTGGAGIDSLANFERIVGSAFNDSLTGAAGSSILEGGGGDDTLVGRVGGADTLLGGDGNDVLEGGGGDDVLNGGAGVNTASYVHAPAAVTVDLNIKTAQDTGGAGHDLLKSISNLIGSSFGDVLTGNGSNNLLDGRGGADTIIAGSGADTLIGGAGADLLTGGGSADTFVFRSVSDSAPGGEDTITDFSHGQHDLIDLSAIDADVGTPGDQSFTYIGANAFSHHAGELQVTLDLGTGVANVYGDVDGDGVADFHLVLTNVTKIVATDFVL